MKQSQADLELFVERLTVVFSMLSEEEKIELGYYDAVPNQFWRKTLAELDFEYFVRFYLRQHFSRPPAALHRETFVRIQALINTPGRVNDVECWPRGFGKTTTYTLGLPLWCVCFTKRHMIPIVSDAHDQAKMQLATLKSELEDNERIKEDFGDLRGETWQEADIITRNGVRITAYGRGMKLRGRKHKQYRPDLIIVDDIEDLEAANSPTQRDGLYAWFTRSLMRSGWDDTKVAVVGNMLHPECLLNKLISNPLFRSRVHRAVVHYADNQELWEQWKEVLTNLSLGEQEERVECALKFYREHQAEMDLGAVSAWPEAFPYYDLMVMRVSEGESAFATEMQNDPEDPGKQYFRHWGEFKTELRKIVAEDGAETYDTWLCPLNGRPAVPLSSCILFAATDPSLGESARGDPSAIVILARAPNRQQFVLEADIKIRKPDKIIADQIGWWLMYPAISRWGIEKVQFQAFFATESGRHSMETQEWPLPVIQIDQTANKVIRIQSLQPDLDNEYILLNEKGQTVLKQQLRQWQPYRLGQKDDGPDCLEMVRNMARVWSDPRAHAEVTQAATHQFNERKGPLGSFRTSEERREMDDLYDELATMLPNIKTKMPDGTEVSLAVPRMRM